MTPYEDYLRQDMRLVILRILAEMPTYRSNSSVLYNVLHQYGHSPSRDQVKTECHWLAEQSLVKVEDLNSVLVVTLAERGADVATGRARVPGVNRPGA
jgi:hypothetical protein